jgi:hypothetical protein
MVRDLAITETFRHPMDPKDILDGDVQISRRQSGQVSKTEWPDLLGPVSVSAKTVITSCCSVACRSRWSCFDPAHSRIGRASRLSSRSQIGGQVHSRTGQASHPSSDFRSGAQEPAATHFAPTRRPHRRSSGRPQEPAFFATAFKSTPSAHKVAAVIESTYPNNRAHDSSRAVPVPGCDRIERMAALQPVTPSERSFRGKAPELNTNCQQLNGTHSDHQDRERYGVVVEPMPRFIHETTLWRS